jgi:hypothetical protein
MERMQLPPDFRDFLRLLNEHQVEYLLEAATQSLITAIPARHWTWTSG